jgi:protein ImuB
MFGCLHSPEAPPAADALLRLAREFTPRIEAREARTVLLDCHGLGRLWPTPESLGLALVDSARARGLSPHVAFAWTRVAAETVARARPGLSVVPPGREAEALSPLPLSLLGLPPERQDLFRRWGLRTLGDLASLPTAAFAERLGEEGPRLLRLARGEDERPLVPTLPPESFACRLELDFPVDGLEPLSFLLGRLLEPLLAGLGARGRRAAAMTLELGLVDGRTHARTVKPAAPSGDRRTWRTLLLLDLEAHPPPDAVQVVAVRAEPAPARTVQFSLLDPARPSPEKLAETLARLQEWTTSGRAGAVSLLDSHRPEAFVLASFAPGPFRPRPLTRSLPPARLALRVFRPPRPARVILREDGPASVSAPGVRGAVVDRAGPWRASGGWWDAAWARDEWDVALTGGGLYRIFFDRLRREWLVAGELD